MPTSIFILSPIPGNIVSGSVQVIGSAIHSNFLQYQLEYGPDPNPGNLWFPVSNSVQSPVVNGLLGIWNTTTLNDGRYQLRLRVFLRDGTDGGTVVVNNITVRNQAPTPVPTNTPTTPRPIASFTQNTTSGTAPLTVQFTNLSSGEISEIAWNFGDGRQSNANNPSHTFNNPGSYPVTLTVTGPGGTSNVTRQISVQSANPPIAAFTVDRVEGTAPLTVQFNDTSTGGEVNRRTWNFGDGTAPVTDVSAPSHTFQNVGTYNVILTVSGPGGSTSSTRQIRVGNPVEAQIETAIDPNNPLRVNLQARATGGTGSYTYEWDFGGVVSGQTGQTATVTYPRGGNFTVTLTVRDSQGNQKIVTAPVTVTEPDALTGSFAINQSSPEALTVNFEANAEGGTGNYTFNWRFGDGNSTTGRQAQHTYSTHGNYTILLTISDGQMSIELEPQTLIIASPVPELTANFNFEQAEPTSRTITFNGQASGGTGEYTYSWNLGDGNTSSGSQTTHEYAAPGSYEVTLTVSDGVTSVTTSAQIVTIQEPTPELTANFNFEQAEPTSRTITFNGQASGGTGEYTYSWNLGDGNTSSGNQTTHEYAAPGSYEVTLTVSDGVNSVTSSAQIVTIQEPTPELTANFNFEQAEPTSRTITFNGQASGGTGEYTYSWNLGDGNTSSGSQTTHEYAAPGSYEVTLTVSDGVTSVTTSAQIVTIQEPTPELTANFNFEQAEPTSRTITFNGQASSGTGEYAYSWNLGDGNTSSGSQTTHEYAAPGSYEVTLTVSDGVTSVTTPAQTVTIQEPTPELTANFNFEQAEPTSRTITFNGQASGGTGEYTYSWNLGDGNTSSGSQTTHEYAAPGSYEVTLTVSDGVTSVTTPAQTVTIQEPTPELTANFNFEQAEPTSRTITFNGQASGGTGEYTYSWNLGDGNTSSGSQTTHEYAAPGSYEVTLTVSDGVTSVTTSAQIVTIQEPSEELLVDLTVSATQDPFVFTLTADATGGTGNYTYTWDAPSAQPESDTSGSVVTYRYFDTGSYVITVMVNDGVTSQQASASILITTQSTTPVQPNIGDIAPELTNVYNAAVNPPEGETPRDTSVVAVIGDATVTDPNFLNPFASSDFPQTETVNNLQSVIDRFQSSFDQQRSVPALNNLISPSDRPECNGQTELVCYINERNAITVIIGVGIQDALGAADNAEFANRLNTAIDQAFSANAIPILLTLYPSNDATQQQGIDAINSAIIEVGNNRNVPVINIWRALDALPESGISGTTPTVAPEGAGFLTVPPTAGFNAMNYYTLLTLNDIVNSVFE